MTKRLLTLDVNGAERTVACPGNAILLDVLREDLHLTGTKRGCDMGTCGCCTVIVDGEARLSCLTLAHASAGRKITTIEGLRSETGGLTPVQEAYAGCGGSQCGFCTPGFIMTTTALLGRNAQPSDAEVREALSGNLCRCTGYVKIFDAVHTAARELRVVRDEPGEVYEGTQVAPKGRRKEVAP
ncbi:MAG TPA: (2Fe-2S)-binding protein [Candidatus Thermoplasmatota archaeon]|nr:(2Fe-2S)-binding protein [Candidatus Thermoplasmatota archaeon]